MRTIITLLLLCSVASAGLPPTPPRAKLPPTPPDAATSAAAAPTPIAEVVRVLSLLPTPQVAFVDFGCGDGRVLLAAAERWPGVKIIGVEIDPARAAACRERVKAAGLEGRITIITGDVLTTDVKADVAFVYLYHELLSKLAPKLATMTAVASYMHQPPGLPVVRNGDSWIYTKPVQQVATASAVWNGQVYSGPQCNDPRCCMCQSIRSQLSTPSGRWEKRKVCNGRSCYFVNVWVESN